MTEGKYRVLKRVGVGINHIETTGTELHCFQYLFAHNRGWLEGKFTVEENPNCRPSFDEWQDEFIKEMAATYGVPESILRLDLSWTDPLKEKTKMKNIDYEAIRKILRNSVVSTKEAVDNLERAMEEVCVMASTSPQKIQGYTAEQWQEIIDGGYLCEFSVDKNFSDSVFGTLKDSKPASPSKHIKESWQLFCHEIFKDHDNDPWNFCRPAQLKGVMRPIFVEPVDKANTACHFFDSTGTRVAFGSWDIAIEAATLTTATKYIEV